jgi:PPP family 3-phenylpropionic acid transporter
VGARVPVLALGAFYFAYFAYVGAFTPYLSLYLTAVGMGAAQIGLLTGVMQASRMVGPVLWGWLADRHGQRMHLVRLTSAAGALGFPAIAGADGFVGLFFALAAMSFLTSAAMPLAEATTFGHVRGDTGRYARIRLWGSIGFIASVVAIGHLLDHVTLPVWLWGVAALYVAGVVAAWAVPESATARPSGGEASARVLLARPEVRGLLFACFMMAAAHGAYYAFYSIHLVDHGYSKAAVGWLWALGVACEIAVFWWMPSIVGRLGLRRVLVASFAIAVLRFLMIGWMPDWTLAVLSAQAMHAATFGAYHAAAVGLIHRWFGGALQARGQALYTTVSFGAGGTLGGIAAGAGWQWLGPAATFSLSAVAAALGLLAVLARVREEPGR